MIQSEIVIHTEILCNTVLQCNHSNVCYLVVRIIRGGDGISKGDRGGDCCIWAVVYWESISTRRNSKNEIAPTIPA